MDICDRIFITVMFILVIMLCVIMVICNAFINDKLNSIEKALEIKSDNKDLVDGK